MKGLYSLTHLFDATLKHLPLVFVRDFHLFQHTDALNTVMINLLSETISPAACDLHCYRSEAKNRCRVAWENERERTRVWENVGHRTCCATTATIIVERKLWRLCCMQSAAAEGQSMMRKFRKNMAKREIYSLCSRVTELWVGWNRLSFFITLLHFSILSLDGRVVPRYAE